MPNPIALGFPLLLPISQCMNNSLLPETKFLSLAVNSLDPRHHYNPTCYSMFLCNALMHCLSLFHSLTPPQPITGTNSKPPEPSGCSISCLQGKTPQTILNALPATTLGTFRNGHRLLSILVQLREQHEPASKGSPSS